MEICLIRMHKNMPKLMQNYMTLIQFEVIKDTQLDNMIRLVSPSWLHEIYIFPQNQKEKMKTRAQKSRRNGQMA